MNIIVFQPEDGPACIVWPVTDQVTLYEIGRRSVPEGVSFWVIDSSAIPEDRSTRSAWKLDVAAMGDPVGVGMPQAEIVAPDTSQPAAPVPAPVPDYSAEGDT